MLASSLLPEQVPGAALFHGRVGSPQNEAEALDVACVAARVAVDPDDVSVGRNLSRVPMAQAVVTVPEPVFEHDLAKAVGELQSQQLPRVSVDVHGHASHLLRNVDCNVLQLLRVHELRLEQGALHASCEAKLDGPQWVTVLGAACGVLLERDSPQLDTFVEGQAFQLFLSWPFALGVQVCIPEYFKLLKRVVMEARASSGTTV